MITIKEISNKSEWEGYIAHFPEANFLQSYNWGQFHQNLGKTISRVAFFKGSTFKGVMLSIVEKAKRATYLTVPGGPLINWQDQEVVDAFVDAIKKIARENNCSFVRVRPQVLETKENSQMFAKLGFRWAPMHLHAELTHQLDLDKSEAELLKNMRKATRYEIKKAKKLGIKITQSQNSQDINSFYKLQMQTAAKHKFVPFSLNFLKTQFQVFAADNQVVLYTAQHKGKILSQAMIIFYSNEADYHYSASSDQGRKFPGSYAIQWAAIKEAKKRGIKRYNFWGVAPEGNARHRFHGVSVFKRGFRGQDVNYLHARDLVIKPAAYSISKVIEEVRKRSRGL